jgi:hypothetical protein
MKCSPCGNRYQGITRIKGKKRNDGTRVKTYYYGCGGYITKGTSICRMNAIPKAVLESKVIETVLDFYRSYLEKGGRQKFAEAIKAQTKVEKGVAIDSKHIYRKTTDFLFGEDYWL